MTDAAMTDAERTDAARFDAAAPDAAPDAGTDAAPDAWSSGPACNGEDADLWFPRARCGIAGSSCRADQRCAYGIGDVNGLLQVCVEANVTPVAEGGACHVVLAFTPGPCGHSESYRVSDCDEGLVCNRDVCVRPCTQWGDGVQRPDLCVDPEYCPGIVEACETPELCDPRDPTSCEAPRECHLWSAPSGGQRLWTCQLRGTVPTTGRFVPRCRSASDCLSGECVDGCRSVGSVCALPEADASVPDAGVSSSCPGTSTCSHPGTTSSGAQVGVCL